MARDPGDKLKTALKLNILESPRSFKNQVGGSDHSDLIRIALGKRSSLNVTMTRLKANADLRLLDSTSKKVLAQSQLSGKQNESISTQLEAGTYYVKVSAGGSRSRTRYQLTFALAEIASSPPLVSAPIQALPSSTTDISPIPSTADAGARDYYPDLTGDDDIEVEGNYSQLVVGTFGNDFGISALFGTLGSDRIYGFTGYDELYGGAGSDLFGLGEESLYYYLGDSYAIIRDFSAADGDLIQLRNGDYSAETGIWSTVFGTISGTVIYLGADPIAIVQNASFSDVNSNTFFV